MYKFHFFNLSRIVSFCQTPAKHRQFYGFCYRFNPFKTALLATCNKRLTLKLLTSLRKVLHSEQSSFVQYLICSVHLLPTIMCNTLVVLSLNSIILFIVIFTIQSSTSKHQSWHSWLHLDSLTNQIHASNNWSIHQIDPKSPTNGIIYNHFHSLWK